MKKNNLKQKSHAGTRDRSPEEKKSSPRRRLLRPRPLLDEALGFASRDASGGRGFLRLKKEKKREAVSSTFPHAATLFALFFCGTGGPEIPKNQGPKHGLVRA